MAEPEGPDASSVPTPLSVVAIGDTRQGETLVDLLNRKIVGQSAALQYIAPYVQMYQAGLAPPDRPAGIFLLLGPTGTGKTRTVEALAEVLHGSPKAVLKVDCGEFQSDHEVAKLIGAPPGYLGHRETKPLLTQERLSVVASSGCDLSLVLFDEVEKAAPSLTLLMLGILDKGTLNLGDNTAVNFERTLIFLTSNLGAREMSREVAPDIGFTSSDQRTPAQIAGRLETIGLGAVRKRFSPEFVNRIDVVVTYQPLDAEAIARILDHHIDELQRHVHTRLGDRSFEIEVSPAARDVLLSRGVSSQYGARELKRTIHRLLTQPLAALVASAQIVPGTRVVVDAADAGTLSLTPVDVPATTMPPPRTNPRVLLLDDNAALLGWLETVLSGAGLEAISVGTAARAREEVAAWRPDLAMLDVVLPDGDGVSLALELRGRDPGLQIILMTGTELSHDEAEMCERHDIPLLRKPFLGQDAINLIQARIVHQQAARGGSGSPLAPADRS
jgi:CheY-like chemotaxis protein/Ni2+-binding GTPase involved in maturation of urease and hydrogenase